MSHSWLQTVAPANVFQTFRGLLAQPFNTKSIGRVADESRDNFVFVIGLHSSGSSALGGVLYHLGVHLGRKLTGYYGTDPNRSCGFEERSLARFCESIIPFPAVQLTRDRKEAVKFLRGWLAARQREARRKGTIAGCKYPLLCRLADLLREIVGERLRVIHINRPLEESIASVIRRSPDKTPQTLAMHQRWLWKGKTEFLAKMPRADVLEVEYAAMLSDPRRTVSDVARFLALDPTLEQMARAVSYIDPRQRHIFGSPSLPPGEIRRIAA